MRIDVITLFPEIFAALDVGIPGRARKGGAVAMHFHQLRDFAINKHGQVDDVPFGGEPGMVLRPEPLKAALDKVLGDIGSEAAGAETAAAETAGADADLSSRPHVIHLSAHGKVLTQERAKELAARKNLVFVCGHYKGVDQRFLDAHVDEELSIGDYVLSGGEMAALVVIDAVVRLLPGTLGDRGSAETDSHYVENRLGWPVYTRPQEFEGRSVPEVLVSGHHEKIRKWRIRAALESTRSNRPDLFAKLKLTDEEMRILKETG